MITLDPVPQVWGVTGNLGGGKTLSAVSLAVWGMSRGYFVVSNVTLKTGVISRELGIDAKRLYQQFKFDSEDFDPFALPVGSPRGSAGGKRVLVILDEAAEWVDQYAPAQAPHIKRFKSWLRHSSKRSQDVIIIVQRLDYLQKDFRLLISKWLVVDDMRVWRVPVLKMTVPFMGGFVMQRVFDRNKKLVQGPCIVRKALYGQFYDTSECLNEDGANYLYEYQPPRIVEISFFPAIFFWIASLFFLLYACERLSRRVSLPVSVPPSLRGVVGLVAPRRACSAQYGVAYDAPCMLKCGPSGAILSPNCTSSNQRTSLEGPHLRGITLLYTS